MDTHHLNEKELHELVVAQQELINRLEGQLEAKTIVIKALRGIKEDTVIITSPKQKGTKKKGIKLGNGHIKAYKFFKAMAHRNWGYLEAQAEIGCKYTIRPYIGELAQCGILQMVGRNSMKRMEFRFNPKWEETNVDFIFAQGAYIAYQKQV